MPSSNWLNLLDTCQTDLGLMGLARKFSSQGLWLLYSLSPGSANIKEPALDSTLPES
jgi:hypothetical protein